MMGIADKAKDFLNSEDNEKRSDDALDRGSKFADDKTSGKHADKVDQARDAADKKIGNE